MLVSSAGAMGMELIRWYGKTRGDLALALLFYGGMAGGVMLINLAPNGSNANLVTYLFGSITTVSEEDVTTIVGLSVCVLAVSIGLRASCSRCARTRSSRASPACRCAR